MKKAIDETNRRREIQEKYNEEHNIVPQTIIKPISLPLKIMDSKPQKKNKGKLTRTEKEKYIKSLEKEMREAARDLDFERAAELRDIILELRAELN